ncbi:MAG TPA: hypothetical protein PKD20_00200 [Candidatus Saccharibacteria bacterium]|jgi:hypothetical protein|nr:hypothetical protein [Candidatus Saccharibacteria bacterium]HMT55277.1 hypothetical protein [Candidatus Saccharibacteria bacterium]
MHKKHGFGLVGILLAVVVIGFVGFAGWYVWSRNKKVESSSTSETKLTTDETRTSQNINATTPEYKSSDYFTFSLPEAWKAFESDVSQENYGWSLQPLIVGNFSTASSEEDLPINFRLFKASDIKSTYSPYIESILSTVNTPDIVTELQINGYEANKIEYSAPEGDSTLGDEMIEFYISHNEYVVSFSYAKTNGSLDYRAYEDDFIAIVNSISFKN